MKTNVNVEFVINGYEFNPNYITDELNLDPSEAWMKGDEVPNRKNVFRRDCCWSIESGYFESFDVSEQIDILLNKIENKKDILIDLKEKFELEYVMLYV